METSTWIPIPTMPSHIPAVATPWFVARPARARLRPCTPKMMASRLHQKPVIGKGIIPMIPRTSAAVPLPLPCPIFPDTSTHFDCAFVNSQDLQYDISHPVLSPESLGASLGSSLRSSDGCIFPGRPGEQWTVKQPDRGEICIQLKLVVPRRRRTCFLLISQQA